MILSYNVRWWIQKSLEAGRDNITSAADVGELLKKVYNHKLISKSDSAEFLDILNKNRDHW